MESYKLTRKLNVIAKTYLSLLKFNCDLSSLSSSHNSYIKFCSCVELSFLSLPAPLRRIINNDFFYQDYPGWWKLCYSKHQYLKLKELAIKKFMEAYYEIN